MPDHTIFLVHRSFFVPKTVSSAQGALSLHLDMLELANAYGVQRLAEIARGKMGEMLVGPSSAAANQSQQQQQQQQQPGPSRVQGELAAARAAYGDLYHHYAATYNQLALVTYRSQEVAHMARDAGEAWDLLANVRVAHQVLGSVKECQNQDCAAHEAHAFAGCVQVDEAEDVTVRCLRCNHEQE